VSLLVAWGRQRVIWTAPCRYTLEWLQPPVPDD
jgi:hypothetical protein